MKKNPIIHKINKDTSGFTIIETLVAVSILMIVIAATFFGAQSGLISSRIARDQVTAFYLAQEVFEYVKNQRDSNLISSSETAYEDWVNNEISQCAEGQDYCVLDSYEDTIAICDDECPVLYQNSNTKIYGQKTSSGWEETRFKRFFHITPVNSNNELRVDVVIQWQDTRVTREYQISEYIYNWRY